MKREKTLKKRKTKDERRTTTRWILLKYGGGGDWYSDPSSFTNLLKFLSQETDVKVAPKEIKASIESSKLIFGFHLKVCFTALMSGKIILG